MPIPEFIVDIRKKIGHDLLWLPGVTGLVVDDAQRVLLVRRADDLRWTLVTGCLDPGEQPAAGIVREILEETGVTARAERVLAVDVTSQHTHPNGDETVFLDVGFVCAPTGGSARVNDDESVDVGWFPIAELPALPERHEKYVRRYLDGIETTWFAEA
ncbi:NUDIX hydrolase [Catenulispora pinisilvae]|uniref:NUDIX hydrolase n=1 Tax=Catenulispora pinisilvae TaxID=2705253 RepID=UPI001891BAB2|nr:NUDIX domain-containing protein [Catenulispora pinisilvae]